MKDLLSQIIDFEVNEITKISGYDNENYIIQSGDNRYILKTYAYSLEMKKFIDFETEILLKIEQDELYPKPLKFKDNSYVKVLNYKGEKIIVRILSFLYGEFLANVEITEDLTSSFGAFLANTDKRLKGHENDLIKLRKWEWDLQHFLINEQYLQFIDDEKDKSLLKHFILQYKVNVYPLLNQLPKSLIYNDANEWNVLTNRNLVSGIIDFGDMCFSHRINELAVAITYISMLSKDLMNSAQLILKSYNEIIPLTDVETKVLYYLIAARLVTSLLNSGKSKKQNPENVYAFVSEKGAWELIRQMLKINPLYAENEFRKAINLPIIEKKNTDELISKRKKFFSSLLSLSYSKPIYLKSAAFQYMYDVDGNCILDAYNNIPHVGHQHPTVVEKATEQIAQLNTNTRYLYDELFEYSEKLLKKFPKKLSKVFFVNSGSAATDLALRLAMSYTKTKKMFVMEHGYHGNTVMAMNVSHYKFNNVKGQGKPDFVEVLPIPDLYREKYSGQNATQKFIDEALKLISSSDKIAAFIAEPIVGCGGQIPLPKEYLKPVYDAIRAKGGVCISDEVQVGFGRLGEYFWGFEMYDVIPDIVILGKPMANGHPMGAVVTTEQIVDSFDKGVEFFSSFGGNPVSCAISSAVLDVLEKEKLQLNAKETGKYFLEELKKLQKTFPQIGDVRGKGLFIGIDIVKSGTNEPDTEMAHFIKNQMRNRNILVGTDGPFDNVIKSKPPLCFTKENVDTVIENLEQILSEGN